MDGSTPASEASPLSGTLTTERPPSSSLRANSGNTGRPAPEATIASSTTSSSKRIRLSLACNNCRKRKVRCDTEIPKCRNCWLRDEECETTDPRYPDARPSVRRWATKDGLLPGQNPAATHRNQAFVPKHAPVLTTPTTAPASGAAGPRSTHVNNGDSSIMFNTGSAGYERPSSRRWSTSASAASVSARTEPSPMHSDAVSASPAGSGDAAGTARPMSWVARGYRDSMGVGSVAGSGSSEVPVPDGIPDADVVVNTDNSSHRLKYMGPSSLQCLSVFVDLYLRRMGLPIMSTGFRSGMRHVEEFALPLRLSLPPLPGARYLDVYLDIFFTKIWPIYPVVDRAKLQADIDYFRAHDPSSPQNEPAAARIPQLVSIYALIAIAADEAAGERTDVGDRYLTAAYGLFAHVVATPYLTSIQALFLLSLALRARFKDGQAWHVIAQAIRIAHSVGLHRFIRPQSHTSSPEGSSSSAGYQVDARLHERLWWSCYALEKLMEFETGRPSAISEEDIDQAMPAVAAEGDADRAAAADATPVFFAHWVALARILGRINNHLYRRRPKSAAQLISETGMLDHQLQEWVHNLPEDIRPGHDKLLEHEEDDRLLSQQHLAIFLSLQYYQAQITLLRASLMFPSNSHRDQVRKLGPEIPSYARLLQSANICASAARATIRQVLELADQGIHSLLLSATQHLLATIALALHILKNPGKRMIRSDLELLVTATEHLEVQFRRGGQHANFIRGFEALRNSVKAAATSSSSLPGEREPPRGFAEAAATAAEQHGDKAASTTVDPMECVTATGHTGAELSSAEAMLMFQHDDTLMVPDLTPELSFLGALNDMPLEDLWGAMGMFPFVEPDMLNNNNQSASGA